MKRARVASASERSAKKAQSSARNNRAPPAFYLNLVGTPEDRWLPTLSINEILSGDILGLFLFNYMFDMEWMLDECPIIKSIPEVHLVAHSPTPDLKACALRYPNIQLHSPKLPFQWGTHHSKMMIVQYDCGIRIWIGTANFVPKDWLLMTQAMWVQDFPFKSTNSSTSSAFEADLCSYLQNVKSASNKVLVDPALHRYDFSAATVAIVGSIPGLHKGSEIEKWGHMRVRHLVENESIDPKFDSAPLVIQISSIASHPAEGKWARTQLCESLTGSASTPMALVWPTVEDVRTSVAGYVSGASMPFSKKNNKTFMRRLFHKWEAEAWGRQRHMPHMKSYLRQKNGQIAWALITSANFSRAAWGELQKNDSQMQIRSYELGVLFLPSIFDRAADSMSFSCTPSHPLSSRRGPPPIAPAVSVIDLTETSTPIFRLLTEEHQQGEADAWFPLPFSIPPPAYTSSDQPWVWDEKYCKPDVLGNRM